jgi:hypothetical protein
MSIPTTPGLHLGLSMDDYKQIDALNFSTIKAALKSPAHLKASLDGKLRKESKAFTFGRAFHAAILEPELYKSEIKIIGGCGAILKSGARKDQECGAGASILSPDGWRCGKHAKGEPEPNAISEGEAGAIGAMKSRVFGHPVVALLRNDKHFEATILFMYQDLLFKARLDAFFPDPKPWPTTILDLKKTTDGKAHPDEWGKTVAKYEYGLQGEIYSLAAESITGKPPEFLWCAVEDCQPYEVGVYRMGERTKLAAANALSHCVRVYKEGMASGEWPGYCTDITNLDAPDWHLRRWGQ